jgi:hypothetical protein
MRVVARLQLQLLVLHFHYFINIRYLACVTWFFRHRPLLLFPNVGVQRYRQSQLFEEDGHQPVCCSAAPERTVISQYVAALHLLW